MRLDRIQEAPFHTDPFDFLLAENTIPPDEVASILQDFPEVPAGGSFDVTTLQSGPAFQHLIESLRSASFRAIVEDKFDIDLSPYPLHITVRGRVRDKDGQIHTDSKDKVLTGLLYLNPEWNEPGGRLRLLRNGRDLENYAFEVAPTAGTMLIFRRSDKSWHGHHPSNGRRLTLQFNWVTNADYARRELARHRLSGWVKKLSGRSAPAG